LESGLATDPLLILFSKLLRQFADNRLKSFHGCVLSHKRLKK